MQLSKSAIAAIVGLGLVVAAIVTGAILLANGWGNPPLYKGCDDPPRHLAASCAAHNAVPTNLVSVPATAPTDAPATPAQPAPTSQAPTALPMPSPTDWCQEAGVEPAAKCGL